MRNPKVKMEICWSAEIIASNLDLLTEILLWTPAKSLMKFKCVSKRWHSLISDPKFCINHARCQRMLNRTADALMLSNCFKSTPEFQLVPLEHSIKVPFFDYFNASEVLIRHSCNGLLLCYCNLMLDKPEYVKTKKIKNCGRSEFRYLVCNPTTKQLKMLSLPKHVYLSLSLAFDPLISPYYKVVCICKGDSSGETFQIDVYSSETESWSLLPTLFTMPLGMTYSNGVFLDGSVHWYSYAETSLYFHIDSQSVKQMPMPWMFLSEGINLDIMYFGESRGHMHLVLTKDRSSLEFDVFEMEFEYTGWSLSYHVNLQSMRMVFPELTWNFINKNAVFSVLSIIQGEKDEEKKAVIFVDGRVMSYNLCDGTSIKICDLEPIPGHSDFARVTWHYEGCQAYAYFQSLVSV
ncbi:hypothetical protein DKX38_019699 [Salix brachista]|uniref:F-box domain-containing protein n=1 Tax=Salix brachista TaxID=2182728 RepID=A0A5N5KH76_9ROSI|nr:hypothetical protein DKX38_019699 [Salix brachista]